MHFKAPLCDAKRDEILFLDGDFSSPAQFFLIVGVFAFLYSLLATIVYVFYQNKYLKHNRGPLVVSQQKLFQCPSMNYISMTHNINFTCVILICDFLPSCFYSFVLSRIFLLPSPSPSCGWSAAAVGPKLFRISRQPQTQHRCFCSSQPAELRRTNAQLPRSLAGHVSIHPW